MQDAPLPMQTLCVCVRLFFLFFSACTKTKMHFMLFFLCSEGSNGITILHKQNEKNEQILVPIPSVHFSYFSGEFLGREIYVFKEQQWIAPFVIVRFQFLFAQTVSSTIDFFIIFRSMNLLLSAIYDEVRMNDLIKCRKVVTIEHKIQLPFQQDVSISHGSFWRRLQKCFSAVKHQNELQWIINWIRQSISSMRFPSVVAVAINAYRRSTLWSSPHVNFKCWLTHVRRRRNQNGNECIKS